MKCRTYALNELETYKFVVVLSCYEDKIMLSRHKKRSTWENQGGHIEEGESPLASARRELFEESGAIKFTIAPAFDYWASDEVSEANGMVFIAHIEELSPLPDSEMAEIGFFTELPENLTYPEIAQILFEKAGQFWAQ